MIIELDRAPERETVTPRPPRRLRAVRLAAIAFGTVLAVYATGWPLLAVVGACLAVVFCIELDPAPTGQGVDLRPVGVAEVWNPTGRCRTIAETRQCTRPAEFTVSAGSLSERACALHPGDTVARLLAATGNAVAVIEHDSADR